MTTEEKLQQLRKVMQREGLSAFIFPSTDPHNGEYIPAHWESRKWISGFTGSAGTVVVTLSSAALWTDSRYFIQAAQELEGTEIQLMKERIAGTPTISQWIAQELRSMEESEGARSFFKVSRGHEVGVDGMVNSAESVESLISELRHLGGITLRTNLDPLQGLWTDRPAVPLNAIERHPEEYCGLGCKEKLAMIRKQLRQMHAEGMLVAALDDIAWTLNLRGSDVHCNPVFVSYLLIHGDKATLFADERKLTADVKNYLQQQGVATKGYQDIKEALRNYDEYNILMDPSEINYTLFQLPRCKEKIRQKSPIPSLKSVKTEAEIAGFRRAMIRDGVALVKFEKQLLENIEAFTELKVDEVLTGERSKQPLFRDISFDTIAGYGAHGAIVHYEATAETDVPLQRCGLILIDSGAQYQDGTTDITRTIALGELTDEERLVYTLVLKGHIDLQLLHFPDGASGTQIDAIARQHLWKYGYNFMHGTGHGVGSYLNVHEGPHQIRMEYRPAPLHAGMTVTDEPGIYVEGKFGVRIENMLLTTVAEETPFGRFLKFETLTLCPIDLTPVRWELLSEEEKEWLQQYHERVFAALSPYLDEEEKAWLSARCAFK